MLSFLRPSASVWWVLQHAPMKASTCLCHQHAKQTEWLQDFSAHAGHRCLCPVSMSAPVPVVGTFWITMRLVGAMSAEPSQHPNGKQEEWQTEGVAQPRTGGREGHGCWPKEPRGEWGSSKKDLGSSEWGHFWKWILQRQWQN